MLLKVILDLVYGFNRVILEDILQPGYPTTRISGVNAHLK
jgi:hypothetical protein